MNEILPGVFHWRSWHEHLRTEVDSYWIAAMAPSVVVDPRVPQEGLDAFHGAPPKQALLTNRHHYRHAGRFAGEFGTDVWCHAAGLHEFGKGEHVHALRHGERLEGGIVALAMGSLTPEETAFLIPVHDGLLAIGDSVVRQGEGLCFVPDEFMGEDPSAVKDGIRLALQKIVEQPFDTLLLAHGQPFVENGKSVLRAFLAGDGARSAADAAH